jgi:hypothetical protein
MSIVTAFIYRLAAVTTSIPRLRSKCNMTLIILAHFFYLTPMWALAIYCINYDYEAVLTQVKEVHNKFDIDLSHTI